MLPVSEASTVPGRQGRRRATRRPATGRRRAPARRTACWPSSSPARPTWRSRSPMGAA